MGIVEVEVTDSGTLDRIRDSAADLRRIHRLAMAAWRRVIAEEGERGHWRPPSGAPIPWAPNLAGTDPLGGKQGSVIQAFLGRGSGSIEEVTEEGATFGSSLPYASVHRGEGRVRLADSRQPFRHKMSRRQAAFLAIRYKERHGSMEGYGRPKGDPDRGFLVIPRRPHATDNPEAATSIAAAVSAFLAQREIPRRLLDF